MKKVCIIGLGYIGLPTAAVLSQCNYRVFGCDIDPRVVETINSGNIHIVEKGLEVEINKAVSSKILTAHITPQASDIYIISVPTPFKKSKSKKVPDLSFVYSAVKSITNLLKSGDLILLESTSPVGTTESIRDLLIKLNVNTNKLHIAYCPERVLPGKALYELVNNSRVVGGLTKKCSKKIADFYRTFVKAEVFETDSKTAELCKLTENSFRDLNIAFANQIANFCSKKDINVWSLIKLANKHPRVNILNPGIGVGGHCIAIDPWFLIYDDKKNTTLLSESRKINNNRQKLIINDIQKTISTKFTKNKIKKLKIAFLGLAFKPNVDDIRESPAVTIVREMSKYINNILVNEPHLTSSKEFQLMSCSYILNNADLIFVLVKHDIYIDLFKRKKFPINKTYDFCGLFDE